MNCLVDCYPTKAQFLRGENVAVRVVLHNPENSPVELRMVLHVTHITRQISMTERITVLQPLQTCPMTVDLGSFDTDFGGFGVDIQVFDGEKPVGEGSTAFDVVSRHTQAMRYGFVCAFGPGEQTVDDVTSLLKFHINFVQFYDWAYRHETFVPPADDYQDLMGKKHCFTVVKQKIDACHQYGMQAIGYGAVYASSGQYFAEHPDEGLYTGSGDVYKFIDIFHIMNIASDCAWHDHIVGEYEKAVTLAGFDGVHMDTYGFPKAGFAHTGGKTNTLHLEECLPGLIDDTRARLRNVKPGCCIIFNNVCNWPVYETAKAGVDAVYIEVWEPYERYYHIQQLITWAKAYGSGKPVILAAYLRPFQNPADAAGAENAALLLTAAIAANGATHLLLGGENGVLTQGYYPDHTVMRNSFVQHMRSYYDFIVRYEELLFDDALRDVSMTHTAGDNLEYVFGEGCSPYPQAGKVWVIIREGKHRRVIHFINLTGNTDDFWNKAKQAPERVCNLDIRMEILSLPSTVCVVSPDSNGCRAKTIDFEVEDSARGKVLTASLPELAFWSSVVIEF